MLIEMNSLQVWLISVCGCLFICKSTFIRKMFKINFKKISLVLEIS